MRAIGVTSVLFFCFIFLALIRTLGECCVIVLCSRRLFIFYLTTALSLAEASSYFDCFCTQLYFTAMYTLSNLVKVTVPNYLASLPIPDTLGGWFRLGVKDWLALIPPTLVVGGISYYSYYSYQVIKKVQNGMAPINSSVRKHEPKVVDVIDIEDINGKQAFCRCWKSAIWPLCDGTHATHNILAGDNAGPLVVKFRETK